jgi:hypothetical protein
VGCADVVLLGMVTQAVKAMVLGQEGRVFGNGRAGAGVRHGLRRPISGLLAVLATPTLLLTAALGRRRLPTWATGTDGTDGTDDTVENADHDSGVARCGGARWRLPGRRRGEAGSGRSPASVKEVVGVYV